MLLTLLFESFAISPVHFSPYNFNEILFEICKIAAYFLWLSLPGDYRVTDEALLAETMTHLLSYECFHCS